MNIGIRGRKRKVKNLKVYRHYRMGNFYVTLEKFSKPISEEEHKHLKPDILEEVLVQYNEKYEPIKIYNVWGTFYHLDKYCNEDMVLYKDLSIENHIDSRLYEHEEYDIDQAYIYGERESYFLSKKPDNDKSYIEQKYRFEEVK